MRHEVVLPRSRPGEDRHEAAAVPEVLRVEGRTMIADLATYEDRCSRGFHLVAQHPTLCDCQPSDEWDLFVTILRSAAKDGRVHQSAVRPLLRGRMQPKHIGLAYRRAIREGLLREVTRERSDDETGRNTNKYEPVYAIREAS